MKTFHRWGSLFLVFSITALLGACEPEELLEKKEENGRSAAKEVEKSTREENQSSSFANSPANINNGNLPNPSSTSQRPKLIPIPQKEKSSIINNLPKNVAFDLGPYECESRVPGMRCFTITDFSRFNYDPYNHRMLMFGGGHSATSRTDLDSLNMTSLQWQSLYPSMTCEETQAHNIDPRGFHAVTGHPVARHTYDMTVIADVEGKGQLILFSNEGFGGTCHRRKVSIKSVAHFSLADGSGWSHSSQFRIPWSYHSAAEFDPISGMIVIVGATRGSGEGGMWIYDPAKKKVLGFVDEVAYSSYENSLVFYPPNKKMYLISKARKGDPVLVREVNLARSDWSKSRSTLLSPTGSPPGKGMHGYAHDPVSQTIGGAISNGWFYRFHPASNSWSKSLMNVMSDEVNEIGDGVGLMLDYDTRNNVFVFIAEKVSKKRRTWVYRAQ